MRRRLVSEEHMYLASSRIDDRVKHQRKRSELISPIEPDTDTVDDIDPALP